MLLPVIPVQEMFCYRQLNDYVQKMPAEITQIFTYFQMVA